MRKILRAIWEFFFPTEKDVDEANSTRCQSANDTCCGLDEDCNKKENDAPSRVDLLEEAKRKAIEACDGCEDEVYVLKFMGEDVDYAKSLNQLIIRNRLPKTNTYAFWNNKQNLNPGDKAGLLLNKYDIVKLA